MIQLCITKTILFNLIKFYIYHFLIYPYSFKLIHHFYINYLNHVFSVPDIAWYWPKLVYVYQLWLGRESRLIRTHIPSSYIYSCISNKVFGIYFFSLLYDFKSNLAFKLFNPSFTDKLHVLLYFSIFLYHTLAHNKPFHCSHYYTIHYAIIIFESTHTRLDQTRVKFDFFQLYRKHLK